MAARRFHRRRACAVVILPDTAVGDQSLRHDARSANHPMFLRARRSACGNRLGAGHGTRPRHTAAAPRKSVIIIRAMVRMWRGTETGVRCALPAGALTMFQSTTTENFESWDKFLSCYYEPIRAVLRLIPFVGEECADDCAELFFEDVPARPPRESACDPRPVSQLALCFRPTPRHR